MHADYLTITCPVDRANYITEALTDTVTMLGGHFVHEGSLQLGHGKVKFSVRYGVFIVTVSGSSLQVIDSYNYLSQFLWPFSEGPHKVTRLDIAHDLYEPSPPHLRRALRKGRSGKLKLTPHTRRPVTAKNVSYIDRHCLYDPTIKKTGTVYLNTRHAENQLVIYDKRNERIDRGLPDPGIPITRYEVRLSDKSRISLRDVVKPQGAFWNVAQCLLSPPPGLNEWNGMAEHYKLEKPPEVLPYELMRRRIENSPDVDHLLSLADRMGPEGYTALLRLLERKRSSNTIQPMGLVESA